MKAVSAASTIAFGQFRFQILGTGRPASGPALPVSSPAPRVNPALHIAVLDDEVDITRLLANYLQGNGYRVTQLHDGRSLMASRASLPSATVSTETGKAISSNF